MPAARPDIANGGSLRLHALGAADWLGLSAAPTFAVMALLTSTLASGPADLLCSAAHASPLGGMAAMYLLMSAFHLGPWLKLIAKVSGKSARSMQARNAASTIS